MAFIPEDCIANPEEQLSDSDYQSFLSSIEEKKDKEDYIPSAEYDYLELCSQSSGDEISQEDFEKRHSDRMELVNQTEFIADQLLKEGINVRLEDSVYMVGVLSGKEIELKDYRNIKFLPVIAARKRAPMLKHLEHFMEENPYCRMWVLTSGPRTTLSNVRETIKKFHRRLSKLASQKFLTERGIEVVFRSTELGEIEIQEGQPTFHIHAHVIVNVKRRLKKAVWSDTLSRLKSYWKHHEKDAERILKVREACKYMVKPHDLKKLSSSQLVELMYATEGLHMVQPLRSLKEQIRDFHEKGLKLVRRKNPSEGKTWRAVRNWNRIPRSEEPSESKDGKSFVAAMIAPAPIVSHICEPVAIVMNYKRSQFATLPRVQRAAAASIDRWRQVQRKKDPDPNSLWLFSAA